MYKKKIKKIYFNDTFNIIETFLISLFNEKSFKKEVFYVHNLNFDGILILEYLSKNENKFKFDVFIETLNIFYIKIFYFKKILEIRCSFKLLPISLKKIAQNFNINPKLPFPYFFAKKENLFYEGTPPSWNYFISTNEWLDFKKIINKNFNFQEYSLIYCERDVLIVSEFLCIIFKMLNALNIKNYNAYSAPSLALKIFIDKYNNSRISFKYSAILDQFLRNSYFGGRCEIYGNPLPDEFIYHFDFSGMYGMCMQEKFCYGKYKIYNNENKIDKPGFYCIEYYSNMDIPVLPHRSINNNKLMFTNGTLIGTFWFEEILLFLKMGGLVKKIFYSVIYQHFDYVFNEYINFFEDIKKRGENYKIFGKLMINSLYGRLGMQYKNYKTFLIKKDEFDVYSKNFKIKSFFEVNNFILIECETDNLLRTKTNEFKKIVSNIALAAAITSKARIKLYKAQQDVIKNGGRLLYSDTDSIFAAYKTNVLNTYHGEVYWDSKNEDTFIKDAIFINPKTYAILYENREIVKIKGLSVKDISFNEIKDKFLNNQKIKINDYRYIRKTPFSLIEFNILKEFELNNYDKRKFFKKKITTRPLLYENYKYI